MRSRGSSLLRARWRRRASAPPPSRIASTLARRSSTTAASDAALRRNSSDRGLTALFRTGIGRGLPAPPGRASGFGAAPEYASPAGYSRHHHEGAAMLTLAEIEDAAD